MSEEFPDVFDISELPRSFLPDPVEDPTMAELGASPNDITIQSHKLARLMDRLPDGTYTIEIVKRNRNQRWQAEIRQGDNVLRTIDLFK
jgi:hypothetical protein